MVAHGTGWVERIVVDQPDVSTYFTPIAITINVDSFEHLEFETRPDQLLVYTLVQGDERVVIEFVPSATGDDDGRRSRRASSSSTPAGSSRWSSRASRRRRGVADRAARAAGPFPRLRRGRAAQRTGAHPSGGGTQTRMSAATEAAPPAPSSGSAIADYFKFAERGTTDRTEARAGLTTFMVMVYIVFLNAEHPRCRLRPTPPDIPAGRAVRRARP